MNKTDLYGLDGLCRGLQGPKKYLSSCKRVIIQSRVPAAKYLLLHRTDDQTDDVTKWVESIKSDQPPKLAGQVPNTGRDHIYGKDLIRAV